MALFKNNVNNIRFFKETPKGVPLVRVLRMLLISSTVNCDYFLQIN